MLRIGLRLICLWCLYWSDNSVQAVKDGEINIGLSSELKAEIDRQVASVVSTLTEKYENRISEMENELRIQKLWIDELKSNESLNKYAYAKCLTNCETNAEKLKEDTDNSREPFAEDLTTGERSTQGRSTQHGVAKSRNGAGRIQRNIDQRQVAFSVTGHSGTHNWGPHDGLHFNQDVFHQGDLFTGYRHLPGGFTAPVAGVYVFMVTLLAEPEPGTWCYIQVNNRSVARLYTQGNTSSQTVIVALKLWDWVAIRSTANSRRVFGGNYSSFSGFLLYEDTSPSAVVG